MSEPSLVRFGVFELDGRTGELRKHGVRLKIQDQPFQVLQALLERPGELVTREELQRKIWAQDTFVDFDQSLNRAINKVRDVLSDPAGAPRFIETLPRRGYRFIAPVERAAEPAHVEAPAQPQLPPQSAPAARPLSRLGWVAACLLAIAAAGLWLARDRGALPLPRLIHLTTSAGNELHPAFSPDGKQVAFTWDGDKPIDSGNYDIYVKVVGDETPSRLTSAPGRDGYPAWSPDGRQIAFASQRSGGGIYLISPLGGEPERKVANLDTMCRPSWSGDGKHLLVAQRHLDTNPSPGDGALFLIPVGSGGDPLPVLVPPPGIWHRDPAYAPDGRSLAFVSCSGTVGAPNCMIQVVALKDRLVPSGDPRRIQQSTDVLGLAWTADGASLIYSTGSGDMGHMWRVGAGNGKKPERVEIAGRGALFPALDFKAGRLAFHRTQVDFDIWRLELDGIPAPFLTSSLDDRSPQYSPDGQRIAFSSGRRGDSIAIWVANADGTGVHQITRLASPRCGMPKWSPDGRWIAFDARGAAGRWDVWIVEASGGSARQLTQGPVENAIPSWSGDGNSIYFESNRSGRFEIWRVSAHTDTAAEQITRNGGFVGIESTDRKTLYYTVSQSGTEGLYSKGLQDGIEKQVVKKQVAMRGFAVFSDGVYYLTGGGKNPYEIRLHEFAGDQDRLIAEIGGSLDGGSGLSVSPDRKTFLFSKTVLAGSDLMLIENFR